MILCDRFVGRARQGDNATLAPGLLDPDDQLDQQLSDPKDLVHYFHVVSLSGLIPYRNALAKFDKPYAAYHYPLAIANELVSANS